MHYFIGSLYGNYNNYLTIKENLNLKEHDELWILGDCLDGNDEHPEECIEIIYDIMNSPNIHLILGDHEYNHIMHFASIYQKDNHDAWEERIHNMDISGTPLLSYIEQNLDEEEKDDIFGFLIQECEITNFITIGDNHFYLVHGFPSVFLNDLTLWQIQTVEGEPDFTQSNFISAIKSDPSISKFLNAENINLNYSNTFVICSHQYLNDLSGLKFENNIFLLGENKPDEFICVLGIDAAGWFIKKIIY